MKVVFLFITLLGGAVCALGQDLTFTKKVWAYDEVLSASIDRPFQSRIHLRSAISEATYQIQRSAGKARQNEEFKPETIFINEGGRYVREVTPNGEIEITKYSTTGVRGPSFEFYEGEVSVLDDQGHFLYVDESHGEATTFLFYSPDLELTNSYRPFSGGFRNSSFGFSRSHVAIYCQEDYDSQKYRLSLLTHDGRVITTTDHDRGTFYPSDVDFGENRIIILFNDITSPKSKIVAFDMNLRIIWEKMFERRISNYSFKINEEVGALLLSTQEQINCVEVETGSTLWRVFVSDISKGHSTSRNIAFDFIGDQYVAVNVGLGNLNTQKTSANTLSVFSISSGVKAYTEDLGSSSYVVRIVGSNNGFLLIQDDSVYEYLK